MLVILAGRKMSRGPAATRTDSNASDVIAALKNAGCPDAAAQMVAAQSALETAGWVGGLWNWNVGNITQPNAALAVYQPGVDLPFAKYDSLAAGAKAMVDLLTAKGVIQHAAAGDLAGYVDALKAMHYAGDADYGAYKTGMAKWMLRLPA